MNQVIAFVKDNIQFFVVIGILTIVFAIFALGRNLATKATTQLDGITDSIDNGEIKGLEGREDIQGSEVTMYVSKWESKPLCITVVTKTGTSVYGYTDTSLSTPSTISASRMSNVKDMTTYVNPKGIFKFEIIKNAADVIVGVTFTQM